MSARDEDCDGRPDEGCHSVVVNDEGTELAWFDDEDCDGVIDAADDSCSVALDEQGSLIDAGDGKACDFVPRECRWVLPARSR